MPIIGDMPWLAYSNIEEAMKPIASPNWKSIQNYVLRKVCGLEPADPTSIQKIPKPLLCDQHRAKSCGTHQKKEAIIMATVKKNLLVRGLSGNLGDQFVVRTNKEGRTIVSDKSNFYGDRESSPAQLAQRRAFREAVAYGQAMKGEDVYIAKANGGSKSPYNIAVADWFNRPEILEIDLSGWVNGDGGTIRVWAQDDVRVEGVKITPSRTRVARSWKRGRRWQAARCGGSTTRRRPPRITCA